MPTCCDCEKDVPKSSFAKSQLKKPPGKRRCLSCAQPLSGFVDHGASDGSQSCWICLCSDADDAHDLPRRDCACRGSAGYAHVSCLTDMASKKADSIDISGRSNPDMSLGVSVGGNTLNPWRECMTCRQAYCGMTLAKLAAAMAAKYEEQDQPVFWRAAAYDNLAGVLVDMGNYNGAIFVIEKRYQMCLDDYRAKLLSGETRSEIDPRMLVNCISQLVSCYGRLGRYDEIPAKLDEAERYAERFDGGERLCALIWRHRATYKKETNNPQEALKLQRKLVQTLKNTPGYEGTFNHLQDQFILGEMLIDVDHIAGYDLMKETIDTAERILGADHSFVRNKKAAFKKWSKLGSMLDVERPWNDSDSEVIATGFAYTRQLVKILGVAQSEGGYSALLSEDDGEWGKAFVPFPAVCLDEGTPVVLHAFDPPAGDFNGKRGIVRGYEFERSETTNFDALRLLVDVEGIGERMRVKPENAMVDVDKCQ